MTVEEKIKMLEEMMELDEGTLRLETRLEDIPEFDSMAKLSLIVLFDDEFSKKLTGEEIKSFASVGDIVSAMG